MIFGWVRILCVGVASFFIIASPAQARAKHARPNRDCASCPQMILIPGGSFIMGAPKSDRASDDMERPQTRVRIKAFWLGKYPVTRREYAYFARMTKRPADKGCSWTGRAKADADKVSTWQDTGFPQSDGSPVVCVTWDDVNAYVAWLRVKTGKPYRLPSEAEWEYAARAGSTSAYPWGGAPTHQRANYGAEQWGPLMSGRDHWEYTSPVGAFPRNGFGLFDMHGNVLEYVQDCFSSNYVRLPRDGSPFLLSEKMTTNPIKELNGLDSCSLHMLRGGDWGDPGAMIRSSARNFQLPPASYRSGGVGFRIALSN